MNSIAAEIIFWTCMAVFFASVFALVIFEVIDMTAEQLGKKKHRKDEDKPIEMPFPKHMKDKLEKKNRKKKK